MVSTQQLLAFGVAALVLIAIPGPSVVFVIGRALAYGRGVALCTVLGNSLGLLVVLVLVALGLGVVVQESIMVFTVLKLARCGVPRLSRRAGDPAPSRLHGSPTTPPVAPLSRPRAVRQGFVVGVSNPKAFMIFAAVLPQFIDRGEGHVQAQMLMLGLLAFAIGLGSDSVWALLASRLRSWFNASPKRGEAMGAVGGVSMIGLGVGIALTGRPE